MRFEDVVQSHEVILISKSIPNKMLYMFVILPMETSNPRWTLITYRCKYGSRGSRTEGVLPTLSSSNIAVIGITISRTKNTTSVKVFSTGSFSASSFNKEALPMRTRPSKSNKTKSENKRTYRFQSIYASLSPALDFYIDSFPSKPQLGIDSLILNWCQYFTIHKSQL